MQETRGTPTIDPLDLPATRGRLRAVAAAGAIDEAELERALAAAGRLPARPEWLRFARATLLFLGAALVLAGVVFFFAYNWAAMGRFLKLGLVAGGIAGASLLAWRLGIDRVAGKVAAFAAAFLIGPLLAVYGQTYQTGADPYELFLGWAALALGFTVVARLGALVLLEVVLANVALALFWVQAIAGDAPERVSFWLSLFALDAAALAAWEAAAPRVAWLRGRWAPRLLLAAALAALLIPTVVLIAEGFADPDVASFRVAALLLAAAVPAALWFYRARVMDAQALGAALLAAIVAISTLAGRVLFEDLDADEAGFFALGVIVIAEAAGAVFWLRRATRSFPEGD